MTETTAPAVSAAVVPSPAVRPPATMAEKVAWTLMAAGLFFVLEYNLLTALLTGLLVYSLIQAAGHRYAGPTLSHHRVKLVAVSLIALFVIGLATALILILLAFLKGKLGHLPTLLDRMASIIESVRERMGWKSLIPAAETLRDALTKGLREHARELEHAGGEIGRMSVHALAGIVIGALAAFEQRKPTAPLSSALAERVGRLSQAFEKVVFAQVKISALNTLFTAVFLMLILPLFGIELHLRKTLVLITFIFGLIPVLGNLGSNTAIVIIALGTSVPAAIACLAYLILIHKLEYFLNARIVGSHIHSSAWEILLAMLIFEAAFGLHGVILAPIVYAYGKQELIDRGLV
jgi:predicted PurR-regulated permease PerM